MCLLSFPYLCIGAKRTLVRRPDSRQTIHDDRGHIILRDEWPVQTDYLAVVGSSCIPHGYRTLGFPLVRPCKGHFVGNMHNVSVDAPSSAPYENSQFLARSQHSYGEYHAFGDQGPFDAGTSGIFDILQDISPAAGGRDERNLKAN